MYSPELYEPETTRDIIQEFGGYNHNVRIGENEFYDMKNLSSANYPTLSPRCKRGKKNEIENCRGLLAKNGLAYVKGNTFYYEKDGDIYSYGLEREYYDQERRLVSMGAYLIVYPDMLSFNTVDIDLALVTDNGKNIKPELMYNEGKEIKEDFTFQLCNEDGSPIDDSDILIDLDYLNGSSTTKDYYFLAKDATIYIDPFKEYEIKLDGMSGNTVSCTPNNTFVMDSNNYIFTITKKGSSLYIKSNWKNTEAVDTEAVDTEVVNTEPVDKENFYDQLYSTVVDEERVFEYEFSLVKITTYCELTGVDNANNSETYAVKRTFNIKAKCKVVAERDDANNITKKLHFTETPWEPIKIGTLRVKKQEAGYVFQRCTMSNENLTPNEIWNEPSYWSDYPGRIEIFCSEYDLKKLVRDIKEAKTSDKIKISLSENSQTDVLDSFVKKLNDSTVLLKDMALTNDKANTMLLPGCIEWFKSINTNATITISPVIKKLDYLIESNNRLWGCRYGENVDGIFVNEIYATALGAFKCWDVFDRTDQDSYVVSVGSDGPFTAAINYRGHPMFFKENCFHMIYGAYPSAYQLVTETGTGVKAGSDKSLCIIQNVLYYHSPDGIYRYDGSSYEKISGALGFENYTDAVAGSIDNKYYVAMTAENGTRELFVYDIGKGLWHKEDAVNIQYFARYGNDLYFVADDYLWTVKGTSGEPEAQPVEWYAESGEIGYSTPDAKYVDKLQLRLSLPVGSSVSLYIEYDSDEYWQFLGSVSGKSFQAFTLPILPRRCDHFRIRISGVGECKIFSLSKILENGGDV